MASLVDLRYELTIQRWRIAHAISSERHTAACGCGLCRRLREIDGDLECSDLELKERIERRTVGAGVGGGA